MASTPDKYARRRARTSAVSTVIGISLVLFMLGILSILVLNAQKLSTYVKESIRVEVFLNADLSNGEITRLKKEIDAEPYSRATEYISKEESARQLQEDLGEEFLDFLDYNPLPGLIDLKLNVDYTHPDSISDIAEEIELRNGVNEVVYSPNLIRQIETNINKIGLALMAFSILLLLIAIALINNTIRLTIYSKRFVIRSMQLVGATGGFIQRPFIWNGILQGLYASFIAILLILGILFAVRHEVPEFFEFNDLIMFVKLFGLVALLGMIISGISTLFAVRRYLRMDASKMY
ncbi:MAG TPA: permease-like cell division protein FtsX [Cryomorphaceae bacterium]|nr:permease-like cell division protein FtsX [Cryomorphaceae bacterium]